MADSKAFRVKHDSDFYKTYFEAKEEKQKFRNLAVSFFHETGLHPNRGFYISEHLSVRLSDAQKKTVQEQAKKYDDRNGFTCFKKTSTLQKKWERDVCSKCDMRLIDKAQFWFFPYIMQGSYALWDYDGEVYGLLNDKYNEVKLPVFFEEIKMSEYYTVYDKAEEMEG